MDADGRPIRVYHGTPAGELIRFDIDKAGANLDSGFLGTGAYFTDNPKTAAYYATTNTAQAPTSYPIYLALKNPFMWGTKTPGVRWLLTLGRDLPGELTEAVLRRAGVTKIGRAHV